MSPRNYQQIITELKTRNPHYQSIFSQWERLLKGFPSSEDDFYYGLIFLSVNEYSLAAQCFEAANKQQIAMPLLLIVSILDPSSDKAGIIEQIMRLHNQDRGDSALVQLSQSLGYRAIGELDLAIDRLPSVFELNTFVERSRLEAPLRLAINLHQLLSELVLSIAVHFMGIKNYQRANEFFASAIEITPTDDHLLCCYALCLNHQMDFVTAKEILELAVAIQPENDSYCSLLAKTLGDLGADNQEILNLQIKAYNLNPAEPEHALACCKTYIRSGNWSDLLEFTSIAGNKDDTYDQRLTCYRAVAAANLLDFDILRSEEHLYAQLGVERGEIADPFICLWFDESAAGQFTRAHRYVQQTISAAPVTPTHKIESSEANKPIKVGIFSGDFCNHAGMTLMLHLFKTFDHTKFELIALDTGTREKDSITNLIKGWCSAYIDCVHLSTMAIVDLCQEINLDIAIDRGGHTGTNRINIFAYRLAPVQVAYLAYPSTTGAEFMDYIVADSIVIPKKNYPYFTECIIQLPCCYQPNSRHLFAKPPSVPRPEELPVGKVVLSCFNALHKLRVKDFELWASILNRNSDTVLWLIGAGSLAQENIKKFFEVSGIDAGRIIFSEKTSWINHQARMRFADLALDSQIYGSHTTATDCLASAVPIVTRQGDGFQTRVCSSILKHLGLEELVAESTEEYLAKVETLVQDAGLRKSVKQKIERIMSDTAVENRARTYSKMFFSALEKTHRRSQSGLPPESFEIK